MNRRPLFPNPIHPSQDHVNQATVQLLEAIERHGGIFDKTGEVRLIVGGKIQALLGYQSVDASIRAPEAIKEVVFTMYQKDFLRHEEAFVTGKVDAIRPSRQMVIQIVGDRAVWTHTPVQLWLQAAGCTAFQNATPVNF